MNAADLPKHELIDRLRAWAAGHTPTMAAVDLLIAHEHWLYRGPFLDALHVARREPVAAIDWDRIGDRLDTGRDLFDTNSERGILAIACSLASGRPVDLRDALGGLDRANVRLVVEAVRTAGGAL